MSNIFSREDKFFWCIILISLAVATFFAIPLLSKSPNIALVNGASDNEIKVYSGQSVYAGIGYLAYYNGASVFFVCKGIGCNWQVEPYYQTPFKLGDIWYTIVRYDQVGTITIKEVFPP